MNTYRVPLNKSSLVGKELQYVAECVSQERIGGDGPYNKKCERLLESTLGVPRALMTTSGTEALEMAALLLDIKPGDEVIIPSFTFVSAANAFVLRGARPVFADIRPDTLNLDETKLESLITPRTKAIVPTHYAGVGCEMDPILEIAERHGVAVVEDNAHGPFAKYKGRNLGTFGSLAILSFNDCKNFTCGEGGALLINDPQYIQRAEIVHEKGTNRSSFLRGEVDKYTWVDLGSSCVLSDILAAFLYAQLEARSKIQAKRLRVWEYYFEQLRSWAQDSDAKLPFVPAYCEQSYHLFYSLMASLQDRQALIQRLRARGVQAAFHYQPLHLSHMGQRFGGRSGDCPVTELVSNRLVRLPLYNDLSEIDQAFVVAALTDRSVSKEQIAEKTAPVLSKSTY